MWEGESVKKSDAIKLIATTGKRGRNSALDRAIETRIYLTDLLKLLHEMNGKSYCVVCGAEEGAMNHGLCQFLRFSLDDLRDFKFESAFSATDKFAEIPMEEAVDRAIKFNEVYNDGHGWVELMDIAAAIGVSIEFAIEVVIELIKRGHLADDHGNYWHFDEYNSLKRHGELRRIEW